MTTYKDLNSKLTGRNAQKKKLENNTYAIRQPDNSISIRLHDTDILTFNPDGSAVVNSGGWKTVTTKARLNEFLPYGLGISQERGIWYWSKFNSADYTHKNLGIFSDGDTIGARGSLKLKAKNSDKETKKQSDFRKKVNNYAAVCAAALPIEQPSGGDCWHCGMVTEEGKPLGDAVKDTSHLTSHMEENYVVPSLVYHAMQEKGCGQAYFWYAFDTTKPLEANSFVRATVKRAVAKYILKRFGMA